MNEYLIKRVLTEELFGYKLYESEEDKFIVEFLYENMILEKLLYGEPISVPELRKLLRKKIVNFEFIKLDGEVRPAKGTTMMKYIPKSDHPKGIRPSSDKVATFYDLDKDAWRSVSKKSKEIVLKKDEKTGKPVFIVKDKEAEIEEPEKEPITKEPITKEPEIKEPEIEEPEEDIEDLELDIDVDDDDEKEEIDIDI
ncbi:MAG: SH3 beta-barrel fold-containing protein, partial [Nanoarchaeota archaeon]